MNGLNLYSVDINALPHDLAVAQFRVPDAVETPGGLACHVLAADPGEAAQIVQQGLDHLPCRLNVFEVRHLDRGVLARPGMGTLYGTGVLVKCD